MVSLKDAFLIDPTIAFLNHGSFGATPRPVFEAYQEWQRILEREPVQFLARRLMGNLEEAREHLAVYLKASPDDLAFVVNATYAINLVARSLPLQPEDEVLSTDHEYGACDFTWEFICRKRSARYIRQPIPLPVESEEEFVARLWDAVNERTRVIFLSHITSPTAVLFPVEAVCQRARTQDILTVIDGAHAPGQIEVDLQRIDPDFYAGNCHKWLLAPKGSGFLYARKERQADLEPLVVSWGWEGELTYATGNSYLDMMQWTGTDDPAAFLAVPAALAFLAENDWPTRRNACRRLLADGLAAINGLTGLPGLYGKGLPQHQMGVAELPHQADLIGLQEALYDRYRVEAPLIQWNDKHLIRISVQPYNSPDDVQRLFSALKELLMADYKGE